MAAPLVSFKIFPPNPISLVVFWYPLCPAAAALLWVASLDWVLEPFVLEVAAYSPNVAASPWDCGILFLLDVSILD